MKTIQIEEDLYQYIASQTQNIGESASEILRRLLLGDSPLAMNEATASEVKADETVNTDNNQKPIIHNASQSAANSVFDLINKEEVATQKGAVGRFLFILTALHRAHQANFESVLEVKGKARNYFATSSEELEQHGSSTKPKQITDSEYWVVTNNNTPRKKLIINEVALKLGYIQSQAEKLREFI